MGGYRIGYRILENGAFRDNNAARNAVSLKDICTGYPTHTVEVAGSNPAPPIGLTASESGIALGCARDTSAVVSPSPNCDTGSSPRLAQQRDQVLLPDRGQGMGAMPPRPVAPGHDQRLAPSNMNDLPLQDAQLGRVDQVVLEVDRQERRHDPPQ